MDVFFFPYTTIVAFLSSLFPIPGTFPLLPLFFSPLPLCSITKLLIPLPYLLVYPISILILFLYNLIRGIVDVYKFFKLHLNIWLILELLILLLLLSFYRLSGSERFSTEQMLKSQCRNTSSMKKQSSMTLVSAYNISIAESKDTRMARISKVYI
jgi:hypothetical protein